MPLTVSGYLSKLEEFIARVAADDLVSASDGHDYSGEARVLLAERMRVEAALRIQLERRWARALDVRKPS